MKKTIFALLVALVVGGVMASAQQAQADEKRVSPNYFLEHKGKQFKLVGLPHRKCDCDRGAISWIFKFVGHDGGIKATEIDSITIGTTFTGEVPTVRTSARVPRGSVEFTTYSPKEEWAFMVVFNPDDVEHLWEK